MTSLEVETGYLRENSPFAKPIKRQFVRVAPPDTHSFALCPLESPVRDSLSTPVLFLHRVRDVSYRAFKVNSGISPICEVKDGHSHLSSIVKTAVRG